MSDHSIQGSIGDELRDHCERFQRIWESGSSPEINDFLERVGEDTREALFRRLLSIDLSFRRQQAAENFETTAAEVESWAKLYRSRFPTFDSIIDDVFVDHAMTTDVAAQDLTVTRPPAEGEESAETQLFSDWASDQGGNTDTPEIAGFDVVRRIGAGGMGVVYLARQKSLGRLVALKVLHAHSQFHQTAIQRLQSEARAIAKLTHPNIVQVFDGGGAANLHYVAMEFIDGPSLSQLLAENMLEERTIAGIVEKVADAIQYSHEQGIVHRDLKPSNILIDSDGAPQVADFGLAKHLETDERLTITGAAIGTPAYMPPEQAQGGPAKPANDIYAIGAILYRMLTGRPPFHGSNAIQTLRAVIERDPVPPDKLNPSTNRDLQTICLKCLEKDPGRRYGSAGEVRDELCRFREGRPLVSRPLGRLRRFARACRREPQTVAAVSIILLSLLLGLATSWHYAAQANERAETATQARDRAETLLYEATIPTAQRWVNDGLTTVADDLLDSLNQDLAGWEYHYLRESVSRLIVECPGQQACFTEKQVFISDADTIRIFDLPTGRPAGTVDLPDDYSLHDFDVSSDGRTVLAMVGEIDPETWNQTTSINLIDVREGGTGTELVKNKDRFAKVMYSPDGSVAYFKSNNQIRRMDLMSRKELAPLTGHTGLVRDYCFLQDEDKLASAGEDGSVRFWNLTTGQEESRLNEFGEKVVALHFNSTTGRLAISDSKKIDIYDLAKQEIVSTFALRNPAFAISVTHDGSYVIAGVGDVVDVYDTRTGRLAAQLTGHSDPITTIVISRDGEFLTTGQLMEVGADVAFKVWRTDRIFQSRQFSTDGRKGPAKTLLVAPNSKMVAVATDDGGRQTDSGWKISDCAVEVLSLDSGRLLQRVEVDGDDPPTAFWFRPDSSAVVFHGPNFLWTEMNLASGEVTEKLPVPPASYRLVHYSRSGRYVAESPGTATIRVWDSTTAQKLVDLPFEKNEVTGGFAFSRDETLLYCGMFSGEVWTIELATGHCRKNQVHDGMLTAMALSSDGARLAAASLRWVTIHDTATFEKTADLIGNWKSVRGVAFNADGTRLVSSATDGTVRWWKTDSGRELLRFRNPSGNGNISLSPDGRVIVAGSGRDIILHQVSNLQTKPAQDPE